ncbi:N,N-dimethylglycine oxidase [Pseudozyma hubeiensis]|nr:N,N-dimethylglycine oxidase [Pseudozyma hubeiensis]
MASKKADQGLSQLLSSTAPTHRIVIIGAGIVGSCLASILATDEHRQQERPHVVLIDRDVHGLPGSTGHAPGYVGQYNQIPALTTLAKRTVKKYLEINGGFDVVGGLEVAQSDKGAQSLKERCEAATSAGLNAKMIDADDALSKAPFFIKEGGAKEALWFEKDGTANAQLIARHEQQRAKQHGALLIDADVKSVASKLVVLADGTRVETAKVILCTGIWTRVLLPSLPIVPVAHPYCYTAQRSEPRALKTPFVRYPEAHVYVRDHGLRDGVGSYAHDPIAVANSHLTQSAYGEWHSAFEPVLQDALALLPSETSEAFSVSPASVGRDRVFNGIFSVTPDGMPLVGKVKHHEGVYVASAVWVTHAAGCAQLIADVLNESVAEEDQWLVKQLDPHRFDGSDTTELERRALGTYNDIYNKNAQQLEQ